MSLWPKCLSAAAVASCVIVAASSISAQNRTELKDPSAFAHIQNAPERSTALFTEVAKVLTHPRCLNCHPATERPLQGNDSRPHLPRVVGGEGGMGAAGLNCSACHGRDNVTLIGTSLKSVPGHPRWHMAPLEMAWEGKSIAYICEQIKDPARNGGKDLAALHDHMAHDDLVGWGWNPGAGREPAPGTQALVGQLFKAWIDTGAHCPKT